MTNLNPIRVKTGKLLFAIPIFIFAATIFIIHSCQKDAAQRQYVFVQPKTQASDRDGFEVTGSWLQTFQTDLNNAINSYSLAQSYTTEQMAAGIEALINVSTTSDKPRTVHIQKVITFQVTISTNGQVLKDIFNGAYNAYRSHWLSTDTSQTSPVVVEVSIASTVGNTVSVRVTSVLGQCNACLLQNYTNSGAECNGNAFAPGEAFYVGGGDEELSLLSTYLLPMCNHPCGTTTYAAIPHSLSQSTLMVAQYVKLAQSSRWVGTIL